MGPQSAFLEAGRFSGFHCGLECLQGIVHFLNLSLRGTIQCDGYSAYDRFAKHRAIEGKPVLLAGCWAHARRGFYDSLDHAPKEAGWVLNQIGHLYNIERSLRRQRAGPVLREAYRASQSVPICRRIHRLLQRFDYAAIGTVANLAARRAKPTTPITAPFR